MSSLATSSQAHSGALIKSPHCLISRPSSSLPAAPALEPASSNPHTPLTACGTSPSSPAWQSLHTPPTPASRTQGGLLSDPAHCARHAPVHGASRLLSTSGHGKCASASSSAVRLRSLRPSLSVLTLKWGRHPWAGMLQRRNPGTQEAPPMEADVTIYASKPHRVPLLTQTSRWRSPKLPNSCRQ